MKLICVGKAFDSPDFEVVENGSELFIAHFKIDQSVVTKVTVYGTCCATGGKNFFVLIENKRRLFRPDAVGDYHCEWDDSSQSYVTVSADNCWDDDDTGLNLVEYIEFLTGSMVMVRDMCEDEEPECPDNQEMYCGSCHPVCAGDTFFGGTPEGSPEGATRVCYHEFNCETMECEEICYDISN